MGIFDEKKAIYEQMKLLIEERRKVTKTYYELKQKLELLERQGASRQTDRIDQKKNNWSVDVEHQKYILFRKKKYSGSISYQDIALKIASYLKECGQPIQTRQVFKFIVEQYNYSLTYNNFVSNILPKIHEDSNINVERVCRGYWQYRLK